MTDKILIGNDQALTQKYGSGLQVIQAAIAKLIAADQGRGLQTLYIAVDDASAMSAVSGTAVTTAADPKQNKEAIDAICSFYQPQYVVLIGAMDVIPHQDLANPAFNPSRPNDDPDRMVPSDLPYACVAPYSQSAGDFLGPARVVSRLPDVTGATDPGYLAHLIEMAANATVLTRSDYADYLGVSAAVWNQSTKLSLTAVFGSGTSMQSVPPATFQWPAQALGRRSHFFNCHGASNTPKYFGQVGQQFPVAHDAAFITRKLTPGTVAAAECCYGAELYDPNQMANGQMGIANVYMDGGAYGFWGSTTIAYGPATSNANADLICQYFFEEVLSGASLGRAALTARLRFVNGSTALSPVDLKTLVQFILLGDGSIQCVPLADAGKDTASKFVLGVSHVASARFSRIERRLALANLSQLMEATKAVAEASPYEPGGNVREKLENVSKTAGMQNPGLLSFGVIAPPESKAFTALDSVVQVRRPTAFHLLTERVSFPGAGVTHLRVLEVTESDGEFVRIRELFSR